MLFVQLVWFLHLCSLKQWSLVLSHDAICNRCTTGTTPPTDRPPTIVLFAHRVRPSHARLRTTYVSVRHTMVGARSPTNTTAWYIVNNRPGPWSSCTPLTSDRPNSRYSDALVSRHIIASTPDPAPRTTGTYLCRPLCSASPVHISITINAIRPNRKMLRIYWFVPTFCRTLSAPIWASVDFVRPSYSRSSCRTLTLPKRSLI